jgi:outer membrane lipoprotein-sorting protein
MKKVIALVTGLMLLMALAGFAQGTQGKTAAAAVKQAAGTIKSVDAAKLVLTHKVQGKDTDTTFVLNADTKKEGDLTVGAMATVHYVTKDKDHIATLVQIAAKK